MQETTEQVLQSPDLEREWQAVLERDSAYDGKFFYGVSSTGIYCRPTCPSRRPNREMVAFFSTPDAAEKAGFRACKRCQPRGTDPQIEIVDQMRQIIDDHVKNETGIITLDAISAKVHLSPYHLQRIFKRVMGVSPRQYAQTQRMNMVKSGLKSSRRVTDAIYDAGYTSNSRLYQQINQEIGMTPTTYQRGGKGMDIHYGIFDTELGKMLIAGTDRGLCAVNFADKEAALLDGLQKEYPSAKLNFDPANGSLTVWGNALMNYLSRKSYDLSALPLDVQATAFQARVWAALRTIPRGQTLSYAALAKKIDQPSATRAVAHACATNPVAVVIPCHRIIREDGSLGGYRWGLERKQKLLEEEKL